MALASRLNRGSIKGSAGLAALPLLLSIAACGETEPQQPATGTTAEERAPAPAVEPATFVFRNARVYTMNPAQPEASAVAVRGPRIVYVGSDAGAERFVGEGTEAVDLGGRLLLPGFIESHVHVAMGGATTSGVILNMSDSLEDVLREVAEYARAHPEKQTIFGASYNAGLFDDRGPDKRRLDEVVPDRPVFLMDHTLHSVWVNSKALEVAGITADTPDPVGGQYVRDASGEPTGAIKGGPAHFPVLTATNAITAESMRASIPLVLEGLSEFGFTSAMDLGSPLAPEAGFGSLVDLDREGKLPLRVSVTHYVNTAALAETAVEVLKRYARQFSSDHVWADTLKITIDSVLENQKAAMLDPYRTTGDRGSLMFDPEAMEQMTLDAAGAGFNIIVHAIGDRGVRAALDAAEALRNAGFEETIFTITHTQMVQPEDRPRFAELDVIVQSTGNWAMQQPFYVEHIGRHRYETLQFPFRDWIDSGAVVSLGADWPATPGGFELGVNPFMNIQTAMRRVPPAEHLEAMGSTSDNLPPLDQVLTLEEAIRGYTINGARQLGIDDEVGSIEVGKRADLVLLDQNLFEADPKDIYKTRVLATMMDGVIRHDLLYGLGDSDLVDLEDRNEIRSRSPVAPRATTPSEGR